MSETRDQFNTARAVLEQAHKKLRRHLSTCEPTSDLIANVQKKYNAYITQHAAYCTIERVHREQLEGKKLKKHDEKNHYRLTDQTHTHFASLAKCSTDALRSVWLTTAKLLLGITGPIVIKKEHPLSVLKRNWTHMHTSLKRGDPFDLTFRIASYEAALAACGILWETWDNTIKDICTSYTIPAEIRKLIHELADMEKNQRLQLVAYWKIRGLGLEIKPPSTQLTSPSASVISSTSSGSKRKRASQTVIPPLSFEPEFVEESVPSNEPVQESWIDDSGFDEDEPWRYVHQNKVPLLNTLLWRSIDSFPTDFDSLYC